MNIFSYIRQQRYFFENEDIPIVDGYNFSQKETIEKVTKYWASQYEGDDSDLILGKLMFDNIVIEPVEKEAEATDFDTKDIEIRPKDNTKLARLKAMVASKGLQEYMERVSKFSVFLNQLVHTRALYGGVLVKDTEEGTKVVPWNNVITDQSDLMSGVIIERHYYTPSELKAMDGKWDNIDEALTTAKEQKEVNHDQSGEDQDTQGHFIEVYELHGVVPEDLVKEDGDRNTYVGKMIVVAGIDWFSENEEGEKEESGVLLYEADEKELPYKYNARNPITGRALGVGVVESLFESQTFHNFTLNEQLRMMSIAGKVFFDTDNPDVPSNLLSELEHGTVLKRSTEHSPLSQVNAVPSSLPAYDRLREEIRRTSQSITGAYESVTGQENKSGTPFRLAALQNIEGHSRYEQEREEIGELIEEIVRDWELPRAMKWMKSKDALFASFESHEILEIDELIINKNLKSRIIDRLFEEGEPITPEFIAVATESIQRELSRGGSKRLVKEFKDLLTDFSDDVRVSTTNEHKNKASWFESRANLIQVLDPSDPRRSALINSIMDEAGITPEELRQEEERMSTQQAKVEFNEQERKTPAESIA